MKRKGKNKKMIVLGILILSFFFTVACDCKIDGVKRQQAQKQLNIVLEGCIVVNSPGYRICWYKDVDKNVTCWTNEYGLSCLPTKDLKD